MMKDTFAKRLTSARKYKLLTQFQLAAKAELPPTSISHFESLSNKRMPCVSSLVKLAKALEVSTDYLLGLKGKR